MKALTYFILGALCFALTQIFTRIPLLNLLMDKPSFIIFFHQHFIFAGFLLALSAGVFEEGGRFLFKKYLLKPIKSTALEPFLFGLGHGLCEAVYLLGPLLSVYPISLLLPALFERVIALVLHICFSFIVWNGFQKNKPFKYLLLAVLAHTLVNFSIPLGQTADSTTLLWFLILLQTVLLFIYSLYSLKFYRRTFHEKD
ncbi:MAG TPA: YhfC family glutamic-type intramembrane protease [Clostridia bacterium]|nr:YhfC family glutamic-type intramembrane protease [Clostridia bacterium]